MILPDGKLLIPDIRNCRLLFAAQGRQAPRHGWALPDPAATSLLHTSATPTGCSPCAMGTIWSPRSTGTGLTP